MVVAAAAVEVVEATVADHPLLALEPVNHRAVVPGVDFPDLQPMLRRRLSVELVLVEVDLLEDLPEVMEEVDSLGELREDMEEVDSPGELLEDMEEVDFPGELPEVVTETMEAAIRLRTAMADRVVDLREVSQMPVRAALPVQVPDQPEEVVTLAGDLDQREDRLALGPDRVPSVDRVVTEEVTPRK